VLLTGSPHDSLTSRKIDPVPGASLHPGPPGDHDEKLINRRRMTTDFAAGLNMQHGDSAAGTPDHGPRHDPHAAVCLHRPPRHLPKVKNLHSATIRNHKGRPQLRAEGPWRS